MSSHIHTLILLTDLLDNVEREQAWIIFARNAAPRNQVVQLELDRRQSDVDARREHIELVMWRIAKNN